MVMRLMMLQNQYKIFTKYHNNSIKMSSDLCTYLPNMKNEKLTHLSHEVKFTDNSKDHSLFVEWITCNKGKSHGHKNIISLKFDIQ